MIAQSQQGLSSFCITVQTLGRQEASELHQQQGLDLTKCYMT